MLRQLIIGCMLLALPVIARAGRGDELVHARLYTDVAHPVANQTFHIGVLFDIQPGWHIYWRNAGDSGLPTTLRVHLPGLYVAGRVQYPVPTMLKLPGNVTDYGYVKQVMLIVPVKAPAVIQPTTAMVTVDANWLVCKDLCLPGIIELSSPLNDAIADPNLIQQWQQQMPVDQDSAHVESVNLKRSLPAAVDIQIHWKSPAPKNVEFFLPPTPGFDVTQKSMKTNGLDTHIHYSASPMSQAHDKIAVDGLVKFTLPDGESIGLNLNPSS